MITHQQPALTDNGDEFNDYRNAMPKRRLLVRSVNLTPRRDGAAWRGTN